MLKHFDLVKLGETLASSNVALNDMLNLYKVVLMEYSQDNESWFRKLSIFIRN